MILLMLGHNATIHLNPIPVYSTLHAVSFTSYSLKYYINNVNTKKICCILLEPFE